jgi:peroxiredoxin
MHDQISKARRRLPWLILAGALVIIVLGGLLLWQPWEPRRGEAGFPPEAELQSLAAPSTSTLLSLARANSLAQGQPAPDFSLKTLDGQATVTLSELRGKGVILNFWASWCAPCRKEMPVLQQAHETYQAQGLAILAINVSSQDTPAEAKAFVEELRLTMPVLLDEGSAAEEAFRILGLPTSFFIDSQGVVSRIHFGPVDEAQLEGYIAEILPQQDR